MTNHDSHNTLMVAGLFAGIGGIELGLAQLGHETILLCENDHAACAVLDRRFPGVLKHNDIRTLLVLPDSTSLVTAGFPCQDLSVAGKKKGISGARSGLVRHIFRLLKDKPVEWVLMENVPYMLHLNKGEAMGLIAEELESLHYRWAYRVVDSRAFGLPQRRRRVYLLASLTHDPRTVLYADDVGQQPEPPKEEWQKAACGFYWSEGLRGYGWVYDAIPTLRCNNPPAIVFPDGRIATPDIRDAERFQGFDPDWSAPAETVRKRNYRWKLVGNAVSVNRSPKLG